MNERIAALAACLIVAIGLTACGGAGAKPNASQCLSAPAVANAIETGLTVTGGGALRGASAVKSSDFNTLWFVAADIQGAGLDGSSDVGVWATNALDGSGSVFAVNNVAKAFSDWGDGGATDAKLSMSDNGANAAVACVASALS